MHSSTYGGNIKYVEFVMNGVCKVQTLLKHHPHTKMPSQSIRHGFDVSMTGLLYRRADKCLLKVGGGCAQYMLMQD